METIELKNFLFHKIAEIDDKSFLEAIKTIIASKTDSVMFILNEIRFARNHTPISSKLSVIRV